MVPHRGHVFWYFIYLLENFHNLIYKCYRDESNPSWAGCLWFPVRSPVGQTLKIKIMDRDRTSKVVYQNWNNVACQMSCSLLRPSVVRNPFPHPIVTLQDNQTCSMFRISSGLLEVVIYIYLFVHLKAKGCPKLPSKMAKLPSKMQIVLVGLQQ